ncbi:MAG: hypothetical protein FJ014_19965 [Chloroflexi bacterium]|nr:hypothetical protein [Chloroflexota bacterium]
MTTQLEILQIPVPPMLGEALGYDGDARWVAFYWTPDGHEVMYDDGRARGVGGWWGWLAFFVEHPAVSPGLSQLPLNLGSSDFEADHWLIIDRKERKAHVAPVTAAKRFLQEQWPPVLELSPKDAEAVLKAFQKAEEEVNRTWTPPTDEEIENSLERKQAVCVALIAWLDDAADIIEELAPVHGLTTTLELIRIDNRLVVGGGH